MSRKPKDILGGKSVGQLLAEGFEELAALAKTNKTQIPDKFTCHTISLDLAPEQYSPRLVKSTREILKASQAIFAKFLGVKLKTVQAWEQGENVPRDSACRFMDEIRHNPPYWQARLQELTVSKRQHPSVTDV